MRGTTPPATAARPLNVFYSLTPQVDEDSTRARALLSSKGSSHRGLGRVYAGETGFDLTLPGEQTATVLGADVAFVRAECVPPADASDAYIAGAPDLAVEISLSGPSAKFAAFRYPQEPGLEPHAPEAHS